MPSVLVFDVNQTLSDMSPLADRFAEVGAPTHLADTWFASVLRDGFGLAAAGASAPFAALARDALRTVLTGLDLDRDLDQAADHVLAGMDTLTVHPDVPDGVRALRADGWRLVTLTNGSVEHTRGLLNRAGLTGEFERLLSVQDAGIWKPAAGAYRYAATECGVEPAELLMIAVHPWDVDGAARAGLATAWLDRAGSPYPDHALRPTYSAPTLDALANHLPNP